jgi:glycosyltransferase involved in cell wall biosynthesis
MIDLNFSIVIPAYNSTHSIHQLVTRLHDVFEKTLQESYEIVIVDDGSPRKETWRTLSQLASENSHVRVFRLAKNFGQGCALLCAMSQARGDWVVTMDDDLQHRPEDIPKLAKFRDHDVVIARFPQKQCGHFKKLSSFLKGKLDTYLLGKPEHLTASPFRLLKARVVKDILSIKTPRPFIMAMLLLVTSDLINVDVAHEPRKYGKSNYTLRKSFSLISNMLFNNSSFMLRAMSIFGFCLSGLSFLFGFYLVIKRLFQDQSVPGWTSMMVVVLISTGAVICCLGIIGEYMARLIALAESRPAWVIRDRLDKAENE